MDSRKPRRTLAFPGRADVLVGTANGKANEQAVNDPALSPHSPANEDVGAPGANEDGGAPGVNADLGVPGQPNSRQRPRVVSSSASPPGRRQKINAKINR